MMQLCPFRRMETKTTNQEGFTVTTTEFQECSANCALLVWTLDKKKRCAFAAIASADPTKISSSPVNESKEEENVGDLGDLDWIMQ